MCVSVYGGIDYGGIFSFSLRVKTTFLLCVGRGYDTGWWGERWVRHACCARPGGRNQVVCGLPRGALALLPCPARRAALYQGVLEGGGGVGVLLRRGATGPWPDCYWTWGEGMFFVSWALMWTAARL